MIRQAERRVKRDGELELKADRQIKTEEGRRNAHSEEEE